MKRLPVMLTLLFICVGLLTTACGPATAGSLGAAPAAPAAPAGSAAPAGTAPASTTGGSQASTPAALATRSEIGLQAWFTRSGQLFQSQRTVPGTVAVGRAAVNQVLAGPSPAETAAGLRTQIPAGTVLRGLNIRAGVATADLNSRFVSGASKSTMPARIAQLVYTLTQFPTVTGVRFQIDGHGVTVLGGVPVQSPQTRAMYRGYLPAITVQSPVIGQQVTSPVTIFGTADVFEATVSVRILNSAGHEIARTFTTATCGTGCRGSYSVTVPYSVPQTQRGTIEVFETSMKNGQAVHVQQIPVTLRAAPAAG